MTILEPVWILFLQRFLMWRNDQNILIQCLRFWWTEELEQSLNKACLLPPIDPIAITHTHQESPHPTGNIDIKSSTLLSCLSSLLLTYLV